MAHEWWPLDIPFQSPHLRGPDIKRYDVNGIIEAAAAYVKAITFNEKFDNRTVEENAVMDTEVIEDEPGEGEQEVGANESLQNDGPPVAQQTPCQCNKWDQCAAAINCCWFGRVVVPEDLSNLHYTACDTWEKYYHRLCIGEEVSQSQPWSCGCTIKWKDLKRQVWFYLQFLCYLEAICCQYYNL